MKAIVAGNIDEKTAYALENNGFNLMFTKPLNSLLNGLKYHPDMQMAVINKTVIVNPELFEDYKDFILSAGRTLIKGKTILHSNYPEDIAYNISVVSNYVFHNTRYTDSEIVNAAFDKKFINVRQGYCGCSICNVGNNAIITSDVPIYEKAKLCGIDALLISSGEIELKHFDYGFIGGASFCYGNTVYFFGKISMHHDYLNIKKFCENHGFGICELTDSILSDYGSLIILD